MSRYPSAWLPADVIAGVTTAAVVIPKAMAFAAIAGLPLQAGLYTALVPLVVYAAAGTSRALSVTTTSTIAILVTGALAQVVPDGDSVRLMAATSLLALLAGGALLLASALRLGFLADFISLPVLTGFKAGIAVVIVVDQLPKLLGVHITKSGFLRDLVALAQHVPEASLATAALAAVLLTLLVSFEHLAPKLPAPLVAVVVGIAASALLGLEQAGVELVGQIQGGLPSFAWPDTTLALQLWPAALGIALMSFVETVAAGRAFARPGEPRPDPNRELLALGLTNIAGSAFHNMPSGGGTSQTAVNRAAGARTQVAGVVTALVVLATLMFLASVVALLPQAALAAVVVVTSVGLFKPAEFAAIRRVRQREFWWAVVAMGGVIFLGTLNGILVAVVVSVLVLIYEANHPPVNVLDSTAHAGLLILQTEGRIHFANAHRIGEQMWPIILDAKPRVVVLEMSSVPDLEYTALLALTDAERRLKDSGATLWLAALNPRVQNVIARAPLGVVISPDRVFPTLALALEAYARHPPRS